ncbi:hypothetical protein Y032_0021g318 [Ancylostoma ceylanicum]|uniref:Uncharacterized protein n=1 Tax=Ancylostoma ceylanicum TaxID=53326 RepID=A0A016UYZ7_9BILA|nr:hypothetical protein Y032_0021g318 [Ancylostoma ceylanicum]
MARANGISRESVWVILREAELKAHKEVAGQPITDPAKIKWLKLCKTLQKRFAADRHRTTPFSDEKWFDIERAHNRLNDRMWPKGRAALEERMIYKK